MSVPYNYNSPSPFFKYFYENQAGGAMPVFRGVTRQRGYGIGSMFARMARGILPMMKNVAKDAGKELLRTGARIAKDVIDGANVSDAARSNLSAGGKNLIRTLSSRISAGSRGGVKRKPAKKPPVKRKRRRLTKDIFK